MTDSLEATGESSQLDGPDEFQALSAIVRAMQPFPPDVRARLFAAAATFFGISRSGSAPLGNRKDQFSHEPIARFSEDRTTSPKEFLLDKKPTTDVERIAA